MKIISLIASSTEMICALGEERNLVGRSHECDFPESVKKLPICTTPKFVTDGTSYEIDHKIKAILQEGLSIYRVFADQLNTLKPDVIITQTQCEVCAVSLKDVEAAVCEMIHSKPKIVALEPNQLSDIWKDLRRISDALGIPERAESLIKTLQNRMSKIQDQAKGIHHKPTVACIEWIEPLMAAGNWMPELVEMAGGVNLFGEAGRHSPWMTFDQLKQKEPEIILILPCGFDIAKTRSEMVHLTKLPGWKDLKAVKEQKVFLADGNQYFNRPGPRVVESLEIIAEILHPRDFNFSHQGKGWVSYECFSG